LPELREKPQLQRFSQVSHTAGATGAGFVADDALNSFHMMKPPQLKVMVQVHELFGQLVQLKVMGTVVVNTQPGTGDGFMADVWFAEVAL